MRFLRGILVALATLFLGAATADAAVVIRVDKATQTMRVIVDGEQRHVWAISSGRMGYETPRGTYRPQRLERMWHSRKYGMAAMPHSIFFRGGYAIHGTSRVGRLGRSDSHGCIRLANANARTLFQLVSARKGQTRIVIEGAASHDAVAQRGADYPAGRVAASRRANATRVAAARSATTQMRLANAAADIRPVMAGEGRRAERRAAKPKPRVIRGDAQHRVVRAGFAPARAVHAPVRAPQPVYVAPGVRGGHVVIPSGWRATGQEHFSQWYLRR